MDGAQAIPARTIDIGVSGMSLALEHPVHLGQRGQISFSFYFDGEVHPICAKGEVSYCIYSSGEFKAGFNLVNLGLTGMTAITKYMR